MTPAAPEGAPRARAPRPAGARPGLERLRIALVIAAGLTVALAFAARPAPTGGPVFRDLEAYYAAGTTWRYETDPYSRDVWRVERTIPGVVSSRDELLPFVGPAFGLPFWSALGRLPWPQASIVWGCVMVLATGTLAWGSLALAGMRVGALDVAAVLIVVAGFGPLTSGIALGQVAVVSAAAIVLTALALERRRLAVALAFPAALAAALQPNLALALVVRLRGSRSALALVSAALVAAGGSALALGGLAGLARYLTVLREHGAAERFITIQTTAAAVARALGASAALAGELGLAAAATVALVIGLQWTSRRYRANDRLAVACAALPLALPFAHEHDFTIALFPAIVVARRARGAAWFAGACGGLLVATDWLGLAQRPTGVVATTLLVVAAALGLALLAPRPLRPSMLAPAALAVIVAAVGTLVARYPLPTWPDGLGPDFHVAATLPAPLVWHLEQVSSGVATLAPAYGGLRLASLAGCALLWLAASRALAGCGKTPGASSSPPVPPKASSLVA